jgi:hypothetical protein
MANYNNYDYVLQINMEMNNIMFSTKTYQKNSINNNIYDINLILNQDNFNNYYNNAKLIQGNINANILGINNTTTFDNRILEILALKIFGHARARAPISNDTDIYANVKNSLFNHINNTIQSHKNDIFNEYNTLGLVETDPNEPFKIFNFNFINDSFAIPAYIDGQLLGNLSDNLKNGPTGGLNNLINGLYNIPILINIG